MAAPISIRTYIGRLTLLAAAYTSVIYLSFFLVPQGGSGASLVWPPAAIGLAALVVFGFELWPALLLPFFFLLLARGITPPLAAAVALGNTLEALVGASILKRFDFDPMMSRLQDAMLLIVAAVVASLASASLITVALRIFSDNTFNQSLWASLWIGHIVSLLSFGTFVIRWGYKPFFTRSRLEWIEGGLLFLAFSILTFFTYWTGYSSIDSVSLLYISIIPLIWISLRTGPRGTSLALLVMGLIGATGALYGFGPLSHTANLSQTLFGVQLIVGILSLIFLLFTSIVEERKEATKALRGHVGQLEVALEKIRSEDQAKSDFIAILAHELRNPLSPLLSGLELLKAQEKGPQDVLHMMGAHLNTVARLLDDLLDISRIAQKKFRLQREPIKIEQVVTQSLEMAAPHITERGHSLTTVLPREEMWLNGDLVRLTQILVNLLNNAAKYTEKGGTIKLEARREGESAVLVITDSGRGIEPSRLKKIFEPFGINDDAKRQGGLHIGLSLAKRMTELHQGELRVESRLGKGTTFIVRLPLMPTAPLPIAAPRPARSRFSKEALSEVIAQSSALEILVVDDNEAAADSLSRLLQHNGHRTLVAYDAPQALTLCETNSPKVALLDIGLPTMDGYELARLLRERLGPSLMLVALTGYGQTEDKHKAKEAGFDDHLTKPVSVVDVERVLLALTRR